MVVGGWDSEKAIDEKERLPMGKEERTARVRVWALGREVLGGLLIMCMFMLFFSPWERGKENRLFLLARPCRVPE